jgi:hypothetical protein
MKPRSVKAKGRNAQNLIKEIILNTFKEFEPDDVKPALMSESGTDIKLSPFARKVFPYSVESKCVEKLNIWDALGQAEKNTIENTEAILFFKRNRSKMYVAMSAEHFMQLARLIADMKTKSAS